MGIRRNLFALSICCITFFPCFADDPATARVKEADARTTKAAKAYEFTLLTDDTLTDGQASKLKLRPKSLLRWSNPIAGELYGNVFVWTHEGRPSVIGSLLQWYSPHSHSSHEMHSLSTYRIQGSRDGARVWQSEKGIELQDASAKMQVAATSRARKTQMRAFARSVSIMKEDREGVTRRLRMLTQPLLEYGSEESSVPEGGLFVFVQGTDPEVFMLVEAHKTAEGKKWHYGFARMNSVKFVASIDDEPVWKVDILSWSQVQNGTGIYFHSGRVDP